MKWLLIIALFHHVSDGGNVVQVKIPMADEAACQAALVHVRVTRNRDTGVDWLDTICVKEPG